MSEEKDRNYFVKTPTLTICLKQTKTKVVFVHTKTFPKFSFSKISMKAKYYNYLR